MISNGNKGNSTLTGADFENKTSFLKRINMLSKVDSKTYELFIKDEFNFMYINTNIFYVPKNDMYSYLYHRHGINYRKIIHKKILPDEVIINDLFKQVINDGHEGIVVRSEESFHYQDFYKRVCKLVRPNFHAGGGQHWRFKKIEINGLKQ